MYVTDTRGEQKFNGNSDTMVTVICVCNEQMTQMIDTT